MSRNLFFCTKKRGNGRDHLIISKAIEFHELLRKAGEPFGSNKTFPTNRLRTDGPRFFFPQETHTIHGTIVYLPTFGRFLYGKSREIYQSHSLGWMACLKKNILTQEDTESTTKDVQSKNSLHMFKNPNSNIETNTSCGFVSSNLFKFHLD